MTVQLISGIVRRSLPLAADDGIELEARIGRYGELCMRNIASPQHALADEGSYFVANNPTPGTAIVHAVSAAVSETAGNYMYLKNNDALGGKRLYLDFIRLICTSVDTAGTASHFFLKADNANRYTSGGSSITPKNSNMDSGVASVAQLYAGDIHAQVDHGSSQSPVASTQEKGIRPSALGIGGQPITSVLPISYSIHEQSLSQTSRFPGRLRRECRMPNAKCRL
jgi:hypothetical protein